jgi:hypothetical protein
VATTTPKRHCESTTDAGKPCGANPLKPGTIIEGITVTGKWCRTHDKDLPTSAKLDRTRTREQMGGRPPKPKLPEVERQLVEQHLEKVLRPYWRTLGYDVVLDAVSGSLSIVSLEGGGAKLYGTSKDGEVRVSAHEDIGAMMEAAEKIRDRVFGRPKQQTEVTGLGGAAVQVDHGIDLSRLTDEELRVLKGIRERTGDG